MPVSYPAEVVDMPSLDRWIERCGMAQRQCQPSEIGGEQSTNTTFIVPVVSYLGAIGGAGDKARAFVYRQLSGELFELFRTLQESGQKVVWRVRPEESEIEHFHHRNADGFVFDPVTYRGNADDLMHIPTGVRTICLYARLWGEPLNSES